VLSESDIEAAHPEAFDFAFGNLAAARRAEFNDHLTTCRYCRAIVDEYAEIGGILKNLPPHVGPAHTLEDRTVAAMLAARDEDGASRPDSRLLEDDPSVTRGYPVRQPPPLTEPGSGTEPVSQLLPLAGPESRPSLQAVEQAGKGQPTGIQARPVVSRFQAWRRYPYRLAAGAAAAAVILIAAIVVPLSLSRGPAPVTAVIPLHVTTTAKLDGFAAATGRATASQGASGSWKISLTVGQLKSFGASQWYQCWYVSQSGQVVSAGTFQVTDGGTWTFPMTSAADPRDFRTMEITLGPPSKTGAFGGLIILSGQPHF
jgi:anti-sigma-K factor RskA